MLKIPQEQINKFLSQFPALAQFCSAYFYQDWNLEAPNALGIIRNYFKDESNLQVQQTIKEIGHLLSLNLKTDELQNFLEYDLKCYYNPRVCNISTFN